MNLQIPELVILDVQMPDMDGFVLCHTIRKRFPGVKIAFITMFETSSVISRAEEVGAHGFIPKTSDAGTVKQAICTILQGSKFFHPFKKGNQPTPESHPTVYSLSKRELEITQLIKKGKTSKAIGELLCISEFRVETHRKNIFKKLKIESMSELISFAYHHKL